MEAEESAEVEAMMTQQQKRAWYNLIVMAATLGLVAGLYPVLGRGAGGFLGFLGLCGFEGIFFGNKKGVVTWDEREAHIQTRANMAAFAGLWIYLTLVCIVPWLIYHRQNGVIAIDTLPMLLVGAAVIMMSVRSIAILVQYGWRERGDAKD